MDILHGKKDEELVRHSIESLARVRNTVVERARRNLAVNNTIRKGATYDINASYALPVQEFERKSGILEKLSSTGDNSWVPVIVILSEETLCFSPLDKLQMADCIPMNEVLDVCAFDDTLDINLKPFESGPAWSSSFNNLDRLTGSKDFDKIFPFAVYTVEKGYNGNRTYFLRAKTEEERLAWLGIIADLACHFYRAEVTSRSKFRQIRFLGRKLYNTDFIQQMVASLIFMNFITNCLDAQFQPAEGTLERSVLSIVDIAFTAIFSAELAVNLFLYWFWPFWTGPDWYWNLFDTIVVLFSILALGVAQTGNANILRTMRAFRVIRVFRRLKTLNLLMLAFYQAATPVLSCMFVLLLVLCIYGIMGVDLYSEISPDLFGTFATAVFTMFQVATLDSWAQTLTRESAAENKALSTSIHFYFASFAVIGGMILVNVIFAVLLDEFSRAYEAEKSKNMKAEERTDAHHELTWPLDPLMETFLRFENEIELQAMISKVFQLCDEKSTGLVDYPNMKMGLKMLHYESVIHLAQEEYDFLANYYTKSRYFNPKNFKDMIHHQLLLYCNRCLTRRHQLNSSAQQRVIFNAMKMLTLQVAKISKQSVKVEVDGAAKKNSLKFHRMSRFDAIQAAVFKVESGLAEPLQMIDFMLKNLPKPGAKQKYHAENPPPDESINPVEILRDTDEGDIKLGYLTGDHAANSKNAGNMNPTQAPEPERLRPLELPDVSQSFVSRVSNPLMLSESFKLKDRIPFKRTMPARKDYEEYQNVAQRSIVQSGEDSGTWMKFSGKPQQSIKSGVLDDVDRGISYSNDLRATSVIDTKEESYDFAYL